MGKRLSSTDNKRNSLLDWSSSSPGSSVTRWSTAYNAHSWSQASWLIRGMTTVLLDKSITLHASQTQRHPVEFLSQSTLFLCEHHPLFSFIHDKHFDEIFWKEIFCQQQSFMIRNQLDTLSWNNNEKRNYETMWRRVREIKWSKKMSFQRELNEVLILSVFLTLAKGTSYFSLYQKQQVLKLYSMRIIPFPGINCFALIRPDLSSSWEERKGYSFMTHLWLIVRLLERRETKKTGGRRKEEGE